MNAPMVDVYPDEMEKLAEVVMRLQRQFEFSTITGNHDKRIFEMAVQTELGEIGWAAKVLWQEIYEGLNPTGVYLPEISILDRVKPEAETDHDRYRHGVVNGLADGRKGYIREDGRKTEDPIKKLII